MAPTRSASSTRFLITGVVLAGIVITIGFLVERSNEDEPASAMTERKTRAREVREVGAPASHQDAANVEARPTQLQLGTRTPCDGAVRTEIELFNRGKTPATIGGWLVSSSALVVDAQPGFTLAPGEGCKVELRVSPWSYGHNEQRVEFRVQDSPSVRVEVSWDVQAAIWAKPSLIVRPSGIRPRRVVLERIGVDGAFLPEPFSVLSVHPSVAAVDEGAAIEAGVATLLVDFAAIDEIAQHAMKSDRAFTFGSAGRWKTLEILVRTDCGACPELHLLVRNN